MFFHSNSFSISAFFSASFNALPAIFDALPATSEAFPNTFAALADASKALPDVFQLGYNRGSNVSN